MGLIGGCAVLVAGLVLLIAMVALLIASIKRQPQRGSGQLGNAMQNLEGIFVESKKHLIEAQQDEHEEADQSGDPPEK